MIVDEFVAGGYSVSAGLCAEGWYAGILALEEVDLRAYEACLPEDYDGQLECHRQWKLGTHGQPRQVKLVRYTAATPEILMLACPMRVDGPVAPKEFVESPVLVWTEKCGDTWTLELYRDGAVRTVWRHEGILRAPQVTSTGTGLILACEYDNVAGEPWILVLDAEGRVCLRTPGRNPRLTAVDGGFVLLVEMCSQNAIALELAWIIGGSVLTRDHIHYDDYTFNADLVWTGVGREVFVVAETCPAFGEGSQLGKHRELVVWQCSANEGSLCSVGQGQIVPVERRAFKSIGPENMPPCRPAIFIDEGQPVVVFRQFRYDGFKTFGWDVFWSKRNEEVWQAPVRLTKNRVLPDSGCCVVPFDGSYVGFFPVIENDGAATRSYNHRVEIAAFDGSAILARFELPEERRQPYGIPTRYQDIGIEPPSLDCPYPGRSLIWGDLHVHSNYSKCVGAVDGSPDDKIRFARDVLGCRVFTLTEHSHSCSSAEMTWCMDRLEMLAGDKGIVLYGTEPLLLSGRHTNWYAYDREVFNQLVMILGSHKGDRLNSYRHAIEELPQGSVIAARHFHGECPSSDETLQRFEPRLEVAMEAMQGRCNALFDPRDGAVAFPSPFLSLGCKIGILGGSDHFRGGPNHIGLTGFWVKDETAEGIWEALHNRYTIGVSNAKVAMAAVIGSEPAGSSVQLSNTSDLRIKLSVSCARTVRRAALIRDGHMLPWFPVDAKSATIELTDPDVVPGEHWYVPTVEIESAYGPETPGYGHTSPFFVSIR